MTVGIIGLGEMGGGMMKRLLLAGTKPAGYNRTRFKAQPLIDAGMTFVDSPHALVELCDVVISIVTNNEALVSIAERPQRYPLGTCAWKNLDRDEHRRAAHYSSTG